VTGLEVVVTDMTAVAVLVVWEGEVTAAYGHNIDETALGSDKTCARIIDR
jgi:hypothetical protein